MCLKILFSWIHFTCRSIYTYFFLQKFERKMINDKTSQFLSQVIFNEHVQSLLLFSLMTKVKTEVLDRVNSPLTIPRTVLIPSRNTGKAMSRYRMPFFQLSTHITSCQQKQQHPSCLKGKVNQRSRPSSLFHHPKCLNTYWILYQLSFFTQELVWSTRNKIYYRMHLLI